MADVGGLRRVQLDDREGAPGHLGHAEQRRGLITSQAGVVQSDQIETEGTHPSAAQPGQAQVANAAAAGA